MGELLSLIEGIIFLFVLFGVPILLTVMNIIHLIKKRNVFVTKSSIATLLVGFLYSVIYFNLMNYYAWYVTVRHRASGGSTPLAFEHLPTILVLFCLSLGGFLLLYFYKQLPPIPSAICISSLLLGCILSIAYAIQLGWNWDFTLLYVFNVVLIYMRAIRQKSIDLATKMENDPITYENDFLNSCARLLKKSSGWMIVSFFLMLPLICIAMIILILFGQRPDAALKVFTDTSDWTFSQQVSPPIEYVGHYLCTVAAQGHPDVVKPMRYGCRHGNKIIVNRQLCVANAFEQYVMEKSPRFHKNIRGFYDRYGYPISKHITTKKRANIIYILMKPLEWAFVLFLYTVDNKPENRIATQYL